MDIFQLLNNKNLKFSEIDDFIEENFESSYEKFINSEQSCYPITENIKNIEPFISEADIFANIFFIAIDKKNEILLDYIYEKGLPENTNKMNKSIFEKNMITIRYTAAIRVITLFEVLEKMMFEKINSNEKVFKILNKYSKEKVVDKFYFSNKMLNYFMHNGYYNLLGIFKDLLLNEKNEKNTLNKISRILNEDNFENLFLFLSNKSTHPEKKYYEHLIHFIIMNGTKKNNQQAFKMVKLVSEDFTKNYQINIGDYLYSTKDNESKDDIKNYVNKKISPFIASIYKDNVKVIKYFLNNGYILSEDEKVLLSTFNENSLNEIIPDFKSQGQEEEYQKFIKILYYPDSENNLSFLKEAISKNKNYIFNNLSDWSRRSMFDLVKSNGNKIEGCSPIDLLILKGNSKILSLILENGYVLNHAQKNKLLNKIIVPNHQVKNEKFNNYIYLNLTEDDKINYFKFVMSEYLSLNGVSIHYENFIANINCLYPEDMIIKKDKSMSDLFSIIANSEMSITNLSVYSRLDNNVDFIFKNKCEYAKGLYNATVQYSNIERENLSEDFIFKSFKFIQENYKEGYEDILSKKESNAPIFTIFRSYLINEDKKLLDKQMNNTSEKINKRRL